MIRLFGTVSTDDLQALGDFLEAKGVQEKGVNSVKGQQIKDI